MSNTPTLPVTVTARRSKVDWLRDLLAAGKPWPTFKIDEQILSVGCIDANPISAGCMEGDEEFMREIAELERGLVPPPSPK